MDNALFGKYPAYSLEPAGQECTMKHEFLKTLQRYKRTPGIVSYFKRFLVRLQADRTSSSAMFLLFHLLIICGCVYHLQPTYLFPRVERLVDVLFIDKQ